MGVTRVKNPGPDGGKRSCPVVSEAVGRMGRVKRIGSESRAPASAGRLYQLDTHRQPQPTRRVNTIQPQIPATISPHPGTKKSWRSLSGSPITLKSKKQEQLKSEQCRTTTDSSDCADGWPGSRPCRHSDLRVFCTHPCFKKSGIVLEARCRCASTPRRSLLRYSPASLPPRDTNAVEPKGHRQPHHPR